LFTKSLIEPSLIEQDGNFVTGHEQQTLNFLGYC